MILTEVKTYLATAKRASLSDLAQRFNTDALALRAMLNHLIRKGLIRKTTKTPACGSACHQCELFSIEIYEWVADCSNAKQ